MPFVTLKIWLALLPVDINPGKNKGHVPEEGVETREKQADGDVWEEQERRGERKRKRRRKRE